MIHSTLVHSIGLNSDKAQEYLSGWRRERAEFDNYRRRVASDQEASMQRQRISAVEPLLSIADNFRSVTLHVPADIKENAWTQGVLHVMRQFNQLLEDQGITIIEETNIPFNPSFHEAVETVAGKKDESGLVASVLQVGYRIGESVIKPAKVKIFE